MANRSGNIDFAPVKGQLNNIKQRQSSKINPTRQFMLSHLGYDHLICQANGSTLTDENGIEYTDFISQYGALPFGHNPNFLIKRISTFFSENEPSLVQPLIAPEAEELGRRLIQLSPLDDGFCTFCNSGAEAVEAAIKLARSFTGRKHIVATTTGFHGKTLGASSATGNKQYSEPFHIDTSEFSHVEIDNLEQIRTVLSEQKTAAVILELVQGEGGMQVLSNNYLNNVSLLCKTFGTLLIIDEVQTGIGRLGSLFGLSLYPEVNADIICLAKALGGGLVSLGAILSKSEVWTDDFGMYHSSTFANNNFSCAIGNSVLTELLSDELRIINNVNAMSSYLSNELERIVYNYSEVFECVNGTGLMLGLKLKAWPEEHSYFFGVTNFHGLVVPIVCSYLMNKHHIITAPVFNHASVLRIEPNLTVSKKQIDKFIFSLEDVGEIITNKKFATLCSSMVGLNNVDVSYAEKNIPQDPILPSKPLDGQCLGRFAFFIHPTTNEDCIDIMPQAIRNLSPEHIVKWESWMNSWTSKHYDPAPVLKIPAVINAQGDYVEGWLISCPLTPEKMMRLRKKDREELIRKYFAIAESIGVDRVGLGAFTSIITYGGTRLPEHTTPVTTGNSLTGMVSAKGAIAATFNRWGSCDDKCLAVVGAAGAVGRVSVIEASRYFGCIILFGNPSNPTALDGLQEVRGEILWRALDDKANGINNAIYDRLIEEIGSVLDTTIRQFLQHACEKNYIDLADYIQSKHSLALESVIAISVSLENDLPKCDTIISATSNGKNFIESEFIALNSVVCDAARPPDFSSSLSIDRPDIHSFEGGLVKLPHPIAFGKPNILGFDSTVNLACLSETIVLAMSKAEGDFSLGKQLSIIQAREIYKTACEFGFNLPDCCSSSVLANDVINSN